MLKICISLVFLSTSLPSLANSYNFLPFTFIAEYIGGFWWYSPIKFTVAFLKSSSVTFTGFSSNTSPKISSVVVEMPRVISAIYSLISAAI